MPHGLHRGAYSSGRGRHPLELNQAANVVTEVHHPNLEPRPRDADGAHDLAAHCALLVAEYVLNSGAHLRARRVRRLLALCQRTIACVGEIEHIVQLLTVMHGRARRTPFPERIERRLHAATVLVDVETLASI